MEPNDLLEAAIHTSLPVADLDRAKRFYADKLGLTPTAEYASTAMYEVRDGRFEIYVSGGAPSGDHTQIEWTVADIEGAVARLRGRGVVFDEYDTPDFSTVNGIATFGSTRIAWFKDSEGNVHSIVQPG